MASIQKMRGVRDVMSQFTRHRANMLMKLSRSLKDCAQLLQRESMKICPVKTGNLRGSAFSSVVNDGTARVEARVGYTASYALVVHERLDVAHGSEYNRKYADAIAGGAPDRGPKQQAKFLEQPARELAPTFTRMVNDGMK